MKNILISLCLLATLTAQAQLLMSENFNYTDSLTKKGWTPISGWGTNGLFAKATGLTHTGYVNSGIGNALSMVASGEDDKYDFTSIKKDALYATFNLRVETVATTTGSYICGFTSGTTGSTYNLRFYVRKDSVNKGFFFFGVGRSTSTATYGTESYAIGSTNLITIKYAYDSTATTNDVVSYYTHPAASTTLTEPTTMTTSNMGAGVGSDASGLTAFFLRQGTAGDSLTATIDGIRVATTWAMSVSGVAAVHSVEKSNFKAHPSITKNIVYLEFDKTNIPADISVVNVQGQVIWAKKYIYTEGRQSVDLSSMANGIYIIRSVSDNIVSTQLIEKQ